MIEELVEMIHSASLLIDDMEDNSTLRCGIPAAHHIYGLPLTINAANYVYFLAMHKALRLEHPQAANLVVGRLAFASSLPLSLSSLFFLSDHMLQFHRGQGMEIWWRENFVSPSEEEYRQMVADKSGSLFNLALRLMQLFSPIDDPGRTAGFEHLCELLSLFFQIRDDYCNVLGTDQPSNKGFCEDLTEGKFSFPILHAVNTRESDSRIIHILKQRTQDLQLKEYCVQLLNEFGSMEYTRQTCAELAQQISEEIAHLNGNLFLENLMRELTTIVSNNADERYVNNHIDVAGIMEVKANGIKKLASEVNGHFDH